MLRDRLPELGRKLRPASRCNEQLAGEISVQYVVRRIRSAVAAVLITGRLLDRAGGGRRHDPVARIGKRAELVVQMRQSRLLSALDEVGVGKPVAGNRNASIVAEIEEFYEAVVDVAVLAEGLDQVHSFQTEQHGAMFHVHLPGPSPLGRDGVQREEDPAGPGTQVAVYHHPGICGMLRLEIAQKVQKLDGMVWQTGPLGPAEVLPVGNPPFHHAFPLPAVKSESSQNEVGPRSLLHKLDLDIRVDGGLVGLRGPVDWTRVFARVARDQHYDRPDVEVPDHPPEISHGRVTGALRHHHRWLVANCSNNAGVDVGPILNPGAP